MRRRGMTPSRYDFKAAAWARKPESRVMRARLMGRSAVLESPVFQMRRRLWIQRHMGKRFR